MSEDDPIGELLGSEPERCEWTMPGDARLLAGSRCVADAGHGSAHVVARSDVGCVNYYAVDPARRTMKLHIHADMRGRHVASEQEAVALYALLTLHRHPREDLA